MLESITAYKNMQGSLLLQVAPLTATYATDAKKRGSKHFPYPSLAALWYNPVICDVVSVLGCCFVLNTLIYIIIIQKNNPNVDMQHVSLLQRRSSAAHKSSGVELEDMLQEKKPQVRIMFWEVIVTFTTIKKNKVLEIHQLQLPFKPPIILIL